VPINLSSSGSSFTYQRILLLYYSDCPSIPSN